MKKNMTSLAWLGIGVICILTSCAAPEDEVIGGRDNQNTNQVFENIQEEMTNHKNLDIYKDNGRHVTATYGLDEYVFKIDADAVIPEKAMVKGKLGLKEMDISLIEQYLCDGEKLVWDNTSSTYISQSDAVKDDDLNYDKSFYTIGSDAVFENFTKDEYYDSINVQMLEEVNWTNENKLFVQKMAEQTEKLLKQLQLDTEYSHAWYETSDRNDYCEIYENVLFKSAPVISKSYGTWIQDCIKIGEYGVESIHFSGLYNIESSEDVLDIMSLDEVLTLIQKGVEEKNINASKDTIDSIQLMYMIDEDMMTFIPVWCFSAYEADYGEIPVLCIDAVNGDIFFMM